MAPRSSEPAVKRPKGGKGSNLQARITEETRSALTAEAERTGRSLSQVAELWMEQARTGRLTVDELLDVDGLGEVLRRLVSYAQLVKDNIGDPARDGLARAALVDGWDILIRLLPRVGVSADEMALESKRQEVREKAGTLLDALRELARSEPENEVVRACVAIPDHNPLGGLLGGGDPLSRMSLVDLLNSLSASTGGEAEMTTALARLVPLVEGAVLTALPPKHPVREAVAAIYGAGSAVRDVQLEMSAKAEQKRRQGEELLHAVLRNPVDAAILAKAPRRSDEAQSVGDIPEKARPSLQG